mmetsp:Transcript_45747/g.115318  ORF Transcript_45747/g.115318 Transcript_45747/m.115318 type:complete len:505 (-) Transcript_45747:273-1787(-)|eukprot:CAMPEP_0115235790 /NCGR_PEP_ID=MMETSP0270-20121206/35503_1 /TAXON_ID=71861 /ORGANISM="Scrippsiella trochoidea, Strain CCMP3099" /LENGTH=504 /DNA_ID=CAMNT_0002650605 /DNA_START=36 /DNA_END=1553 /DNA_ORIENTATION=-
MKQNAGEESVAAGRLVPKEEDGEEDDEDDEVHDQFELRRRHTMKRIVANGCAAESVLPLIIKSTGVEESEGEDDNQESTETAGESQGGATGDSMSDKRGRAAKRFGMLRGMLRMLKVCDDSTAPLPMKCGWLEKMYGSVFVSAEKVWVVLRSRALRWFASPQDHEPLGHIDFELLPCEVSKQWTSRDESRERLHGMQKRSRCGGCDIFAPLMQKFLRGGVVFHLRPAGSCENNEAVLALRADSIFDGETWVDMLKKHIGADHIQAGMSAKSGVNIAGVAQSLSVPRPKSGGPWWLVKSIAPSKFCEIARTGDILMFRSPGTVPSLIRKVSGGHFDHVALLLRLEGGRIGLLEATGNQGVNLCGWDEFVINEWHLIYHEIAMRRVAFERTESVITDLQTWAGGVLGKPYSLSIGKLMQRKSISAGGVENDDAYFCSQLVAEALKVLKVLPRGKSSTQYWPSSFEAAAKPPLETLEGCSFDDELTLVFPQTDRKAQAGRDDTVRLF